MKKYVVVQISEQAGDIKRYCHRSVDRGAKVQRRVLGETVADPPKIWPEFDKRFVFGLAEEILGFGYRKKGIIQAITSGRSSNIRLFGRGK